MTLPSYASAEKWMNERVSMPTSLSSAEYTANIPAKVRANAFFSARVAEARVLEQIRSISDAYTSGEMSLAEARTALRSYVQKNGFSTAPTGISPEAKAAFDKSASLRNIASTARLNLILRQQALQAEAVGRYAEGRNNLSEKYFPCWRYIARPGARDSHAAFNGKVFRKDDPIWQWLFPPRDYNCRCTVEECTLDEAGKDLGNGNAYPKELPPSGYDFNPAEAFECDAGAIKDTVTRQRILANIRAAAENAKEPMAFAVNPARTETPVPMVQNAPGAKEIQRFIDKSLENLKTPQGLKRLAPEEHVLDLGSMSVPMTEAFGLETVPRFQIPLQGGSSGIAHSRKNHLEELQSGLSSDIIARHLSSSDIKTTLNISSGKADYINMTSVDPKTGKTFLSSWVKDKKTQTFKLVGAYEIYASGYLSKLTVTGGK